jgi:hypothetical protein
VRKSLPSFAATLMAALLSSPAHASDSQCRSCHPAQTAGYAKSGMAQSMSRPVAETAPNRQFRHVASGTQLRVGWQSGRMIHTIERSDGTESHPIAWAIGSGKHGKSYLLQIGDAIFQSPLSWYSTRKDWGASPGFENDSRLSFFRPITTDCLSCHSQEARPVRATLNRYLDPPFDGPTIGCIRCHGDPALHLSRPERQNIINPGRLDPDRRDAICEQCHLSGEARIPNPNKDFADFRPGMRLEEVFTVYVRTSPGDPNGLKVVSHSEQMTRSRCFLESNSRMWCGTCHDPHREPEDKAAWYRQKCVTCHSNAASLEHEKQRGRDCAGCHMPAVQSYDGGHAAFHDHWIRRERVKPKPDVEIRLRAWRNPDRLFSDRNLGLAYISAGSTGDPKLLREGMSLLPPAPADGVVETARGFVFLRMRNIPQAILAFRRAWKERPNDSTRCLNLAAALLASGDRGEAKEKAERAIALEPLLEDAYAILAEIEPQQSASWKARYMKLAGRKLAP